MRKKLWNTEKKIPLAELYRQLIQLPFYGSMETARRLLFFFFGILSFFLMEIEAPLKVLIANNTKYIEYVQSLYF